MSAAAIAVAVIPENVVLLAAVGALYHLLRQGGGLQVKAPGAPRKTVQQPAAEPDGKTAELKEVA